MSKRSKKTRVYIPEFPIEDQRGVPEEGTIRVAEHKVYVGVREHTGEILFGMAKSFDRWANSRDFVARLPKTERQYEKTLAKLEDQILAGNWDKGWGKELRL